MCLFFKTVHFRQCPRIKLKLKNSQIDDGKLQQKGEITKVDKYSHFCVTTRKNVSKTFLYWSTFTHPQLNLQLLRPATNTTVLLLQSYHSAPSQNKFCSPWLRLKQNTKIGLHTTTHPPPPPPHNRVNC